MPAKSATQASHANISLSSIRGNLSDRCPTVVCTLWLSAFPTSYVRLLRNAVKDHLKCEHRFICITDNPSAIDSDIEAIEMPDVGIPFEKKRSGCWPKINIFAEGLLPPNSPTLYLDLDVLIRGNLDQFFEQITDLGGFHSTREWNPSIWELIPLSLRPDRGVQGALLGFIPKEHYWVHELFASNQSKIYSRYHDDQRFLEDAIRDRYYWPFDWTASFKRHCVKHFPINIIAPRVKEPNHAKVVIFHGNPRPIDVVPLGNYKWGIPTRCGFGPVPWVRDYWLRYDTGWHEPNPGINPLNNGL